MLCLRDMCSKKRVVRTRFEYNEKNVERMGQDGMVIGSVSG